MVASGDGGLLQDLGGAPQHSPHRRHPAHLGMVCRRASPMSPETAEAHSYATGSMGTKRQGLSTRSTCHPCPALSGPRTSWHWLEDGPLDQKPPSSPLL